MTPAEPRQLESRMMADDSNGLISLYTRVFEDDLSSGDIAAGLENLELCQTCRALSDGQADLQSMLPAAKISGQDLTLLGCILQHGYQKALQERNDEEQEMLSQDGNAGGALASIASQRGLQRVSAEAAKAAALVHIRTSIQGLAKAGDEGAWLNHALHAFQTQTLPFLKSVISFHEQAGFDQLQSQLQYYVFEQAGLHLIQSLFDLVVDFPDSLPALQDLRTCLQRTSLLSRLAQEFEATTRRRLLHPGAATTDIVQQYILSIKALGHVDSTGTGLAPAKSAIQEYLRGRADAVRCIVGLLTSEEDGGTGMLDEEFRAGTCPTPPGTNRHASDVLPWFEGPDVDLQALAEAEHWAPAPAESTPHAAMGDAVSQLVDIWGSHDLFVSEYRTMLGDRLLGKSDYECDHELRTLELLKLRFGDAALHTAEIMLKDMTDSRRLDANIQTLLTSAGRVRGELAQPGVQEEEAVVPAALTAGDCKVSATMLSELYWPRDKAAAKMDEDLKLPPDVQAMLQAYGNGYHRLKSPRKLVWNPSRGQVTLEVTVGGQSMETTVRGFAIRASLGFDQVSPAQATVLLAFRQAKQLSKRELAAHTGLTGPVLVRAAEHWARKGILAAVTSLPGGVKGWARREQLEQESSHGCHEEDLLVDAADAEPQLAVGLKIMETFEPFILGMLANFDALPLDRIHNMLKMFASDPPYDRSMDDLAAYLKHMVLKDILVADGGGVFRQKKA